MKRRIALPVALALIAGATAAVSQTVTTAIKLPCLTPPEAEAMVTAIIPEMIENVGQACARTLPPSALIRQTSGPFIDRYRAEADLAWPRAQAFVNRIAGTDASGLLNNAYARPLIATLIAPAVTKKVQPGDCATIERIVTLAQPLPPRSAAGLFVSIVQLVDAKRGPGKAVLPVCIQGKS